MFCNLCHVDIGDQIGLCQSCRGRRDIERTQELSELKDKIDKKQRQGAKQSVTNSESFPLNVVEHPLQFIFYILSFLIFLTPLFFFVVLPKHNLGAAVLLAFSCAAFVLSISLWAVMWIELTFENPMICFLSLLLPIGVYSLVISHPERTRKPFFFHLFFGTLGVATLLAMEPLTKVSGTDLLWSAFSVNTEIHKEEKVFYEIKDAPSMKSETSNFGTRDNPIRAPKERME